MSCKWFQTWPKTHYIDPQYRPRYFRFILIESRPLLKRIRQEKSSSQSSATQLAAAQLLHHQDGEETRTRPPPFKGRDFPSSSPHKTTMMYRTLLRSMRDATNMGSSSFQNLNLSKPPISPAVMAAAVAAGGSIYVANQAGTIMRITRSYSYSESG